MAKITEKNTKSEILSAYKDALTKIEEMKSTQFNPAVEKEAKRKEEVVKKADETVQKGIINQSVVDEYNNLKEAIQIQKNKLKNVYGIEAEADSFAALYQSKQDKLNELDAMIRDKKDEFDNVTKTLKDKYAADIAVLNEDYCEMKQQLEKERTREREEYTYQLKRERQIEQDKYEDEKAKKEAELTARENAVREREISVEEVGEEISILNGELAALRESIEEEKQKAADEMKAKLEKQFTFERNALKKDKEYSEALRDAKIDSLEEKLCEANATIDKLNESLTAAYEKVQSIAQESVKNSGVRILESGSANK